MQIDYRSCSWWDNCREKQIKGKHNTEQNNIKSIYLTNYANGMVGIKLALMSIQKEITL